MSFATYEEARNYLYGLKYHGAKYGIDRMRGLSVALGHPERRFPVIHVTGTNGKGSTAAMLESIYRAAGYRTGLFTSPHLVHQGERIQVDRGLLRHDEILEFTNRLRPVAEALERDEPGTHPSFFEFMTAMAFEKFAAAGVGVGIIEVGLGGRLDATNVVLPEASVITSISLDHCELLGDTVEQIAAEKAGIVKPGRPVVLGHLPAPAEAVVRAVAAERGCAVHTIREAFGEDLARYPATRLEGSYQRWNAATAALTARLLQSRLPVTEEHIARGLATVQWAGRWDRRPAAEGKTIILDSSHNAEGAEALEDHLAALHRATGVRPVVLTGSLGEKRAQALFETIARHAREIVLLRPNQPRALPFEVMEASLPAWFEGGVRRGRVRDLFPAPGVCLAGEPGETVVATGSIYLIGEIMEALLHHSPVAEETLQD